MTVTPASTFGGERAEHHADRGLPAGRRNRQELPCGVCG
ncbi:hypothetical protein PL329_14825 [Escherichia coli]|nr:hypothetical protein [Escherichia coli]WCE56090.1 hypothetical protein PL329_14825 [Escherichia coli]